MPERAVRTMKMASQVSSLSPMKLLKSQVRRARSRDVNVAAWLMTSCGFRSLPICLFRMFSSLSSVMVMRLTEVLEISLSMIILLSFLFSAIAVLVCVETYVHFVFSGGAGFDREVEIEGLAVPVSADGVGFGEPGDGGRAGLDGERGVVTVCDVEAGLAVFVVPDVFQREGKVHVPSDVVFEYDVA